MYDSQASKACSDRVVLAQTPPGLTTSRELPGIGTPIVVYSLSKLHGPIY